MTLLFFFSFLTIEGPRRDDHVRDVRGDVLRRVPGQVPPGPGPAGQPQAVAGERGAAGCQGEAEGSGDGVPGPPDRGPVHVLHGLQGRPVRVLSAERPPRAARRAVVGEYLSCAKGEAGNFILNRNL